MRMTPSHPSWRFHATCCLCYTLACLAWNYWAGRDQSWDQLNYHLYVALAWWQNRLPDELFAASAQGYLNPLPHLPFFAAWSTGWHSLAIASLMAVLHSINLWLLHFIGLQLIPGQVRLQRLMLIGGVLLGGLTPAFLIEVGGSLTDVVVSIPALASLLCLGIWLKGQDSACSPQPRRWAYLHLSGVLAGLSIGLKPSGLVFAAALALSGIVLAGRRRALGCAWRSLVSGLTGFLLGGGAHAWMLWKHFENPVFPLFNATFRSPWFPPVNLVADRFRPASLADALRYPFDMVDATTKVGLEALASDIRPVTLLGLLAALCIKPLIQRQGSSHPRRNTAVCLLGLTLLAFIPAWLYSSGNTRYAVPALLLLGPLIGWTILRLGQRYNTICMLLIGLALTAQTTLAFTLNLPRWEARNWTSSWFDLSVPATLLNKPAYYLSLQTQSHAFLAAILPPETRMSNLIGQNTLPPDSPVWRTIQQQIERTGLPLRSLYSIPQLLKQGEIPAETLKTHDAILSEYGLMADSDDCTWIVLDGNGLRPPRWAAADTTRDYVSESQRSVVLSCALIKAPDLSQSEQLRRKIIDERLSRWEVQCPHIFAPSHVYSVQYADSRQRAYINTEVMLSEAGGQIFGTNITGKSALRMEDKEGRKQIDGCPESLPRRREGTSNGDRVRLD